MKKLLLGLFIGLGMTAGVAYGASVFNSNQVGNSPGAGKVLQTDGSISTWVATSTLGLGAGSGEVTYSYASSTFPSFTYASSTFLSGIVPIANGGTATSTAPASNALFVGNGTNFFQSVLPSCSNGTTSKLLYNNTTRVFTCGTDVSGGGAGATTTITSNVQTDGPNFTFATGSMTGLDLRISGSGSTLTFANALQTGYVIPLQSTLDTFSTYSYASSTYPSRTYASSTFPSFSYASSAFQTTLTFPLTVTQGGTGTSTWRTGSIPFYNGTRLTESNSFLYWDNTNSRLGLGSSTPSRLLTVNGTIYGSIQDSGGQVYNVKAYGAVGDGVTNDIAAFRSAIAAATSTKGTVFVPPGTFALTGEIKPDSNLHIKGAGVGLTTLKGGASSGYMFTKTGTAGISNFTLSDMTLDVNNTTAGSGVRVEYGTNITFRNLDIKNIASNGWGMVVGVASTTDSAYRNTDITIDNVDFTTHAGSLEQLLVFNAERVTIENSYFSGIASSTGHSLALYQNLKNVTVKNNTFSPGTGAAAYYSLSTQDLKFIGNSFYGNSTGGVKGSNQSDNGAFNATTTNDLLFDDNTFYGNSTALQLGAVKGARVVNNHFEENIIGILIDDGNTPVTASSTSLIIEGNTFKNNNSTDDVHTLHPGILFQSTAGNVHVNISNNEFFDDQATQTQRYPITFEGSFTWDYVTISNNRLSAGSGGTSVRLNTPAALGSNVKIYGNRDYSGSSPTQTAWAVTEGGTGTTTAPSLNQLLLGNASSGYNLVATSTLGMSASGTAGHIQFSTGSGTFNADQLLNWDNTNNRLGIGLTNPSAKLHIQDASSASLSFEKTGGNAGTFSIYNDGFANIVGPGSSPSRRFAFYDQMGAGAGTMALPPFTNFNDTNTGIYFPSNSDEIGIVTGGGERIRFTGGKVGINTTSPIAVLTVSGTSTAPTIDPFVVASSSGTTLLQVAANGSTTLSSLGTGCVGVAAGSLYTTTCGGGSVTGSGTNGYVSRWTSASALSTGLFMDNGTVAGVNATSSTVTFNVQGSAGLDAFNIASSTGTSLLRVLHNGNVGIGTTTPGSTLTIVGTLEIPQVTVAATLTRSGQLAVNTTNSTLTFHDGTAQRYLNPEKLLFHFYIENPAANEKLGQRIMNATSTITKIYCVNTKGSNDTGNINLVWDTTANVATSSAVSKAFTSFTACNGTSTPSNLSLTGSTTINSLQTLHFITSTASSSGMLLNVYGRENQ